MLQVPARRRRGSYAAELQLPEDVVDAIADRPVSSGAREGDREAEERQLRIKPGVVVGVIGDWVDRVKDQESAVGIAYRARTDPVGRIRRFVVLRDESAGVEPSQRVGQRGFLLGGAQV